MIDIPKHLLNAENERCTLGDAEPKLRPFTDAGNAERFVDENKDEVRFVHGPDRWLIWTGSRWAYDDTDEVVERAITTARNIRNDATVAEKPKLVLAWARQSEGHSKLRAMLDIAKTMKPIAILPDDLDRSPDLLNLENGTIDLQTGKMRPHEKGDLITKLVPAAYDPAARCATWDDFLSRVLPDALVRSYVQRCTGYSLTGDISEHVLFFLHGSGANGKTVFIETIQALLNDYAKSAADTLLIASRQDRHPTEVADLLGARFVAATEVAQGRGWDEPKVKKLTGGDTVKARWMRKDFFDFKPVCKLWISGNHRPLVEGTDDGFWRRMQLIEFPVSIPPEERDHDLLAKLKAEMPGILAWAVRGCLEWRLKRLDPPKVVLEAVAEYRAHEDIIGTFIEERCIVDKGNAGYRVKPSGLYDDFREWAGRNGETNIMSSTMFGTEMNRRGFKLGKSNGAKWRYYITLKPRDG